MNKEQNSINGIVNVYKEAGFTSFDVVAKLRGITRIRRIGHTGTLDPDATGVLPVCIGSATKLCDMLTDKTKEYEASFILGITTDTQDISGKVLEQKEVDITLEQLADCINSFVGKQQQIPPMYSAIKINGQKLYDLARAGKEVERPARDIEITRIDIVSMSDNMPGHENCTGAVMRVECSKGTYIRTLCHDIGQKLGCGATMTKLVRTRSGQFKIDKALKLSEIEELVKSNRMQEIVIPVDEVFEKYPALYCNADLLKKTINGNSISAEATIRRMVEIGSIEAGEIPAGVRVYDDTKRFIAFYEYNKEEKKYIPQKMFLG